MGKEARRRRQVRPGGYRRIQRQARLHRDRGEGRVTVTMMMVPVLPVIRIGLGRSVMAGVRVIRMRMVMGVGVSPGRDFAAFQMPMHLERRRPGELERNDEHDDQGEQTAHQGDSTDSGTLAKGVSGPIDLRRTLPARSTLLTPKQKNQYFRRGACPLRAAFTPNWRLDFGNSFLRKPQSRSHQSRRGLNVRGKTIGCAGSARR